MNIKTTSNVMLAAMLGFMLLQPTMGALSDRIGRRKCLLLFAGRELWSFDPQVPGEWARNACCDVVNRGVAVWQGKAYVATLDGRLIAIDANTGKPLWSQDTLIDRSRSYTITGAPRIAGGRVVIGNGGGEIGVRGYVTAYDAESGALAWRFFTVTGDPKFPVEHPELEAAAKNCSPKGGDNLYLASILAINPDTGAARSNSPWRSNMSTMISTPFA